MNREELHERVEHALAGVAFRVRLWVRVACPFCFDERGKVDRKTSLGVRSDTGAFRCFRCGKSGRLNSPPDPDAIASTEERSPELKLMDPPEEYAPLFAEPGLSAVSFDDARSYVRSRGLDRRVLERAQVGAAVTGYWSGRVIVPVLTTDRAAWLGWVGRAWFKKAEIPYLYPKGMERGRYLDNHDALFVKTDAPILVVEGVFDALALGEDAVAVFGKPSHEQMDALMMTDRPVVWVLDGDAWEEGWSYAMRMRFEGRRAGSVRLPPTLDPDEVDRAWLTAEVNRAVDEPL